MPNHVKNILAFDADREKIQQILNDIKDDEVGVGSIDFNKLIPRPKSLNIECGSDTDKGFKLFTDMKEEAGGIIETIRNPRNMTEFIQATKNGKKFTERYNSMSEDDKKLFDLGKRAFNNIQNYGTPTWYEWSIANWDTKWNAYDCSYDKDRTLFFHTAWSAPDKVIKALSEKYPDIQIGHIWADEDIGNNLGKRIYFGGEVILENIPEAFSKEAYDLAFKVWDCTPADYGLILNSSGTQYVSAVIEEQALLPGGEDDEELEI